MKNIIWKLFLSVYIVVLFLHVFDIRPEASLFPAIISGLLLAVIAHRSNHWSSIPFLVLHMIIEAIEFSSTGFSLGTWTIFWIIVHIGMDVVFLYFETKKHFPQAFKILFSSIVLAVACVYLFSPKVESSSFEMYHEQIELFVLGGVIGCVLSHLLPHKHKHE